jgi:hypothetical protein
MLRIFATLAILQPAFLLALVAADYCAPRSARLLHLQTQPPISVNQDSECGALSIGLDPSASLLSNAIVAGRPIGSTVSVTTCTALHRVATGDTSDIIWYPLNRYWHGYRVETSPLIALMPWRAVQFASLALLACALTYFAWTSSLLIGWVATIALLVPTLALTDLRWMWTQTYCVSATCLIFAGSGWFVRQISHGGNLSVTAAALGSIFNFLDLLTNPPWQPMLLMFFVLAAGRRLRSAVAVLACWTAGYAGTWATKWGIAVIYGGDWNDIWETILFRLDGSYEQVVDHRMFASSAKIISQLAQQSGLGWIAVAALTCWLLFAYRANVGRWAFLSLPSLVPFMWFEVLRNHTQIHAWFAYRPAATSIGVVLAAWVLAGCRIDRSAPRASAGLLEDFKRLWGRRHPPVGERPAQGTRFCTSAIAGSHDRQKDRDSRIGRYLIVLGQSRASLPATMSVSGLPPMAQVLLPICNLA